MKILKEISTAQFEAEFLRGEFYKPTYRHVHKELERVLVNLNDYNRHERNYLRYILLKIERGGFLAHLPKTMRWYLAGMTMDDLLNARIINEGSWHNVFGDKRKISDITALIETGICDGQHVPKISQIIETIIHTDTMDKTTISAKDFKKAMNGKMIFLKNKKNEVSILEGNHRAVSLIMLSHAYNCDISHLFPMKIVVGDLGNKKCTWF